MAAISLQTNVNALMAEQNLNVNNQFQSNTIEQLTSGYRINSSADDPAGLAVANMYRSDETELTQGVRNANDGISTLQIADGGMSNISQMLDSLRSLATQSASNTFEGDRGTLNDQFQALLTEIDRQAQSIGLNTGGEFAKNLSIYIGGGKNATSGALDTGNGTVSLNLANSAVDTEALGLRGTQVVANTSDIQAALTNGTNTGSLTNGNSIFYFSGPGFADGSQVKVSVNLNGVNNLSTLVDAINTGIQSASQGSGAVTQAFAKAGIVASVHTDSTTGAQSLAFTSSSSAFQVQAGDQMANAFMGNVTSGHGTAISSTVSGAGNVSAGFNGTAYVQISGAGLTSPIKLTLADTSSANAVSDLVSQVQNNTALQAAGISVSGGAVGSSALVFTSAFGDPLNVQVTGDTNNNLGFGSFISNAGAVDYTSYQGTAYNPATAGTTGTTDLEFSFNGGASAANNVSVDLAGGDATKATATAATASDDTEESQTLNVLVDGAQVGSVTFGASDDTAEAQAADINGAGIANVTATVDSTGHLIIDYGVAGGHSLSFTGTASGSLGFVSTDGQARSGQSVADALNSQFSAQGSALQKAGLHATFTGGQLTISSDNGTNFRINTGGTASTANIGFGTGGVSGYAGATVSGDSASVADANGTTQSGALTFNPMLYGSDTQAITFSAPDSSGALQSTTITLQNSGSTRTGQSIDSAIQYINQQLQGSNNATLQQIVAVKEDVGGTQKINFISSLTGFSVSFGNSPNGDGFSGTAAGSTVNATALGTGGNLSIDTEAGATQAVTAVANAITALGTAQGAVGQSENQLNYAINLAQSQITNFSAAESRIRDADVASEAANLTKAQVLQQASIAAMAQANSAPQAVLALLRG